MRRIALLLAVSGGLAGCGAGSPESKIPTKSYQIHGVIEGLDPDTHMATIKHQEIKGFMDAMTMDFPVRDAGEFSRLRKGETIDGTLFVRDTDVWVGDVRESK